jgi:hypothetical protein
VSIEILDERYIARYFQIAAVGASIDYMPSTLRNKVLEGIFSRELVFRDDAEFTSFRDSLAKLLDEICASHIYTPSIYTAGIKDKNILSTEITRATGIPITIGKKLDCSYLRSLTSSIKRDHLSKVVKTPIVLRATVFSRFRDLGEVENIEVGSLWLALIGSVLTLSSVFKEKGAGKKDNEIYILPDGSLASIDASKILYRILHSSRVNKSMGLVISNIIRGDIGVSIECMILLSAMIHFIQEEDLAYRLADARGYEAFSIYRIAVENRPQLTLQLPLAISEPILILKDSDATSLLDLIYSLIYITATVEDKRIRNALQTPLAHTINSLFRYFETGIIVELSDASAILSRVYTHLLNIENKNSRQAAMAASMILNILSKIARKVR